MTPTSLIIAVLAFFLFLWICGSCVGTDPKSNQKRNTKTYTNKNTHKPQNNRNYYGHGPYDPGEYYSEWGDDGGYE